jgi:DNA-binding transcriptional LysR family regulator
MNIHHLELFYYAARHGGISRAVRNMPYGIQQPAVSSQVHLLEQDLGLKLFERNPFKLTPAGEELYAFARPFFDNLDEVAGRLRRRAVPQLRLAASEVVLRDYLPAVIARLREREPRLRLALRSGFQDEMERWLLNREIDLVVMALGAKPPAQLHCRRLLRIPLVLLVPKKARVRTATELWGRGEIEEPLICLPQTEAMCQLFKKGLKARRVEWPQTIEASSMDLVTRYVANGYGYGLSVDVAGVVKHPAVRVLALDGFEPVEVAALWPGEGSPLLAETLAVMQRYVAAEWPQWACPGPGH